LQFPRYKTARSPTTSPAIIFPIAEFLAGKLQDDFFQFCSGGKLRLEKIYAHVDAATVTCHGKTGGLAPIHLMMVLTTNHLLKP
jgi:hypothetical protein